jgi:methyl halide transferase
MNKETSNTPRDAAYWQAIYEEGDIGWDKGEPAPPLVRAMNEFEVPHGSRILVPGCGLGHEVLYLAKKGFQVTAVDFASSAIAGLKARAGDIPIVALQRDLFTLDHDHSSSFDVVIEHTYFCAIPKEMRDEYARVMHAVLSDGGRIVGLFYETDKEDGPPHRTTKADIEQHFSCLFEIVHFERPVDSFDNRLGNEWLVVMGKR